MAQPSITVLIVNDSAFVRALVRGALSDQPGFEVIGFAATCQEALDQIEESRPDAVIVDLEMSEGAGCELLDRLQGPQQPAIVVLVSLKREAVALALDALERGAFEYAIKPRKTGVDGLPRFREILCEKIALAVRARRNRLFPGATANPVFEPITSEIEAGWVAAVGIGSGGPQTLLRMLPAFPAGFPAILVAQHMPPLVSAALAERLGPMCRMAVREAVHDEPIKPGAILIAPGGMHMEVARRNGELVVQLEGGPRVSGHRPSADLLFDSVARACGPKAVAVIMTGAGRDGVAGLTKAREAGAWTLAQDRATSAVFGMAAAAIRAGVVDQVLPLAALPGAIASTMRQGCREAAVLA